MISLRRPDRTTVERYRRDRLDASVTCDPSDEPLTGFQRDSVSISLGTGDEAFDRGRRGVQAWAAHRGAGVDVVPDTAEIRAGEVVALVTRQLGLWVLAACRIVDTTDEPSRFGFTYATLPDHPECGYECFTVHRRAEDVTFEIGVVSTPGIAIVRLGAPVTRVLQHRATDAYLRALQRWEPEPPSDV